MFSRVRKAGGAVLAFGAFVSIMATALAPAHAQSSAWSSDDA